MVLNAASQRPTLYHPAMIEVFLRSCLLDNGRPDSPTSGHAFVLHGRGRHVWLKRTPRSHTRMNGWRGTWN